MNKHFLYWIGYTALLLIVGFIVLSGTDKDVPFPVSGKDAFTIAASRTLYWVFIVIAIVAFFFGARYVNKLIKEDAAAGHIHAVAFAISAFLLLAVFVAPANIKADPVGSGATTEQIKVLRDKIK